MIGETIGNFEIVGPLGKGGMGEVWLARHQAVHNLVAIKLLAEDVSEDHEQVERFFNQAQAAGRIQHAGVGQIFDVGYAGGRAFLVMEYLAGDTLRRRLRAGPIERGRAVELGKQIASVLGATHAAGVIHRDLKPENIILVRDPSIAIGERAKLVDFGIAKLGDVSLTSTSGPMMGTPLYMSPEQWRNVAKVEPQSDTYALGCVLFEMLCGRTPFLATAIGEACAQHLTDAPPRLRSFAPDVPEALERLVLQMLEKVPAKRPAMTEVEQRLGAFDLPMSAPQPMVADAPVDAMQATQLTAAPSGALEDTRLAPRVPPKSRSPEASEARVATDIPPLVEVTPPTHGARWVIGGGAVLAVAVGVWLLSRGSGTTSTPDARAFVDAAVPVADAAVPVVDAAMPVVDPAVPVADAAAPADTATRVADAATVPHDAAVATASKHSMQETGKSDDREFLIGKDLLEPISATPPPIYKPVSIRVCFASTSGVVDRVGVSNDVERDDPRLGRVIRKTVLGWRYASYSSSRPLVCLPVDLRPTVTVADFDAANPQ